MKEANFMDINRAMEIVSSPDMANVTLFGQPVFIENINRNNETAVIHLVDQPHKSREISLEYLVEQ